MSAIDELKARMAEYREFGCVPNSVLAEAVAEIERLAGFINEAQDRMAAFGFIGKRVEEEHIVSQVTFLLNDRRCSFLTMEQFDAKVSELKAEIERLERENESAKIALSLINLGRHQEALRADSNYASLDRIREKYSALANEHKACARQWRTGEPPERGETYLATIAYSDGKERIALEKMHYLDGRWFIVQPIFDGSVIAWQPLPEPWKEGE